MSSDYGYINARVRGLKTKLLGDDFFNNALSSPDFKTFNTLLAQSSYASSVEEASAQYQGLKMVDSAIGRNFYSTARSVLNLASGSPEKLIGTMLMRYDLHNLKTIARAKIAGRSADDIRQSLFPAGKLKPAALETIAETADLAAAAQAVSLTRHPLASTFNRAVAQNANDGNLYAIELALDRAYYKAIFSELDKISYPDAYKRHLQREVDVTNIRTALKVKGQDNVSDLFIKGGREINSSTFDALLAGNMSVLTGTAFAKVAETTTLSQSEEVLGAILNQSAERLRNADPLNIGVVLDFFRLKEAEGAKLRLLARGKFYGVAQEALAKELGNG